MSIFAPLLKHKRTNFFLKMKHHQFLLILLAVILFSGILLHVRGGQHLLVLHIALAIVFSFFVIRHTRMVKGKPFRADSLHTAHIAVNPHLCKACWKCLEGCPKGVFGKVDLPLHKHIKIVHPDACIGCKKCVRNCPNKAITERED